MGQQLPASWNLCPVSFFLSSPYSLHEVLFIHIIRIVYICSKFVSPYSRTCSSAMQEFSINMRSITSTDIVLTSSKRWSLSCTAYRVRQRRWSVYLAGLHIIAVSPECFCVSFMYALFSHVLQSRKARHPVVWINPIR